MNNKDDDWGIPGTLKPATTTGEFEARLQGWKVKQREEGPETTITLVVSGDVAHNVSFNLARLKGTNITIVLTGTVEEQLTFWE